MIVGGIDPFYLFALKFRQRKLDRQFSSEKNKPIAVLTKMFFFFMTKTNRYFIFTKKGAGESIRNVYFFFLLWSNILTENRGKSSVGSYLLAFNSCTRDENFKQFLPARVTSSNFKSIFQIFIK